MIIWLTGQPSSGKTTIANQLLQTKELADAFLIDGDRLRELFNNKDFSRVGRVANVKIAQDLAYYLNKMNKMVIVAMVSPYREQREEFKGLIKNDIFEVFTHSNQIRGKEAFYVKDYEPPITNFIDMDTTDISVSNAANKIIQIIFN